MLNRKGLTLIEIIIAIAIIGIISLGILSGFTSGFSMITMGRDLTEDTFRVQQEIEHEMEDMKEKIEEGTAPTPKKLTLFSTEGNLSREVDYFEIKKQLSNGSDVIVYTSGRLPQFPLYEVGNVNIGFSDGTNPLMPFTYIDSTNIMIEQTTEPAITDPDNVRAAETYRWFVSRPGFNIPIYSDTDLDGLDIGSVWPARNDFNEIKSGMATSYKSLSNSEIEDEFAGRHIIHTVVPGTIHGRTGVEVISNYLFIPGLPYSNNLKLHLDASFINPEDSDEVVNNNEVKRWKDVSSIDDSNNSNDYNAESDSGSHPKLGITDLNNSYWRYIYGNNVEMDTSSFSNNQNDMTVFMAVKLESSYTNYSIIGNNDWDILYNASGNMEYRIQDGSDTYNSIISTSINPDKWYVLTGIVDNDNDILTFRMAGQNNTQSYDLSSVNFDIGNIDIELKNGINIAEIIVYDEALSDSHRDDVEEYLNDKYNPPVQSVRIDYLYDMTREVVVGDTFDMPLQILAKMTNGATQNVSVNWDPNSIDTSTTGTHISTGTAVSDPTKTMTLTVNVKDLETYTVEFIDHLGLLSTQSAIEGSNIDSADFPTAREPEDQQFVEWNPNSISNISSDLEVHAQYIDKYSVKFKNESGEIIEGYDYYINKGGNITTIPPDPYKDGHTFINWYPENDFENIQVDKVYTPVFRNDIEATIENLENNFPSSDNNVNSNHNISLPATNSEYDTTITWSIISGNAATVNNNILDLNFPSSNGKRYAELKATVTKDEVEESTMFNIESERYTHWIFIFPTTRYRYSIE